MGWLVGNVVWVGWVGWVGLVGGSMVRGWLTDVSNKRHPKQKKNVLKC